jgi:hypothetical protein
MFFEYLISSLASCQCPFTVFINGCFLGFKWFLKHSWHIIDGNLDSILFIISSFLIFDMILKMFILTFIQLKPWVLLWASQSCISFYSFDEFWCSRKVFHVLQNLVIIWFIITKIVSNGRSRQIPRTKLCSLKDWS